MKYYCVHQESPMEISCVTVEKLWRKKASMPVMRDIVIVYARDRNEAVKLAYEFETGRLGSTEVWCEPCGSTHLAVQPQLTYVH